MEQNEQGIKYYAKATLHYGVRCKDVYAEIGIKNIGDEELQYKAALEAAYKEFHKLNTTVKREDITIVKAD